jgi:aminopeptidase YwaD
VDIGPRPAGSEEETEARDYAVQQLSGYDYDVEVQPFPFSADSRRATILSLETPQKRAVVAIAASESPEGTASAELVDAGLGRQEDFPDAGLNGAIALVQRGAVDFPRMVQNAAAAGASAMVIVNNEPGPLFAILNTTPAFPVVGISPEDGDVLLALLAQGAVTATLDVGPSEGTADNVLARPSSGHCETVSGAHYDSFPQAPGANDNASGAAVVLELARAVAAAELEGDHCFALFGAEEIGLQGSLFFVGQLTEQERAEIRAMLNFDVVGGGAQGLVYQGDAGIVTRAADLASNAGIPASVGELPEGLVSDHANFQAAGIPSIWFATPPFDFIHTPLDTIDRIDPSSLERVASLAFLLLSDLAGS